MNSYKCMFLYILPRRWISHVWQCCVILFCRRIRNSSHNISILDVRVHRFPTNKYTTRTRASTLAHIKWLRYTSSRSLYYIVSCVFHNILNSDVRWVVMWMWSVQFSVHARCHCMGCISNLYQAIVYNVTNWMIFVNFWQNAPILCIPSITKQMYAVSVSGATTCNDKQEQQHSNTTE